jgi:Mn-containing catalase
MPTFARTSPPRRAITLYERLFNMSDDLGIKDALGFIMTRESSHKTSFE